MKVIIDIPESTYKVFKQLSKIIGVLVYEKDILTLIKAVKNGTPLPKGETNGDMIKALFPNYEETRMCGDVRYGSKEYYNLEFVIDEDWWDAPYEQKEVEQ
jgi:hypothetical protein